MELINLKQITPSKSSMPEISKAIIQSVKDGWEDALTLSAKLDFVSKICSEARNDLKEMVLTDIQNGKSAIGYKVEIAEVGVTYDYSNCNDNEIVDLYKKMDDIKEKIKKREKFLKLLPATGFEYVDPNSGEIIKLYPPAKKSTTSPKFTLQK